MLHQDSHRKRAHELHWTVCTVEWRIQFPKMQKGELTVHHCQKWRGFTPSSRHVLLPLTCVGSGSHKTPLWTSSREYTPRQKSCLLSFGFRKEHSSQEEGVGMSKQPVERAGKGKGWVEVKPPPLSAAASHCIDVTGSRTTPLTAQHLTFATQITIVSSKIAEDHYDPTHLQMEKWFWTQAETKYCQSLHILS